MLRVGFAFDWRLDRASASSELPEVSQRSRARAIVVVVTPRSHG
jgi:hypothetical protein